MGDQPDQQPDPDLIEWTDPEADALFARVEAAITADLPAVDEAAVVARVRAVVGPEFDKLREQIQALQVSDGYQTGWEHGVQAATAHHQRQATRVVENHVEAVVALVSDLTTRRDAERERDL